MRAIAVVNIFRWEVMATLAFLRVISRWFVKSWRASFVDQGRPFAWDALASDLRGAYQAMAELAPYGAVFMAIVSSLVVAVPASLIGFPLWSQILSAWAVSSPFVVCIFGTATSWIVRRGASRREARNELDVSAWEFDIERNPRVMFLPSVFGSFVSLVLSIMACIPW